MKPPSAFQFKMSTPTLSLAQQDLVLAFRDQLTYYGHILTSGTNTFPALMTPVSPVDLAMIEMFQDKREVSIATALRSDVPAGIVAQSSMTDENSQSYTVMQRNDNPSQIYVEFWMVKKTDKDH